MENTVKIAVLGAGDRGEGAYGEYVLQNRDKVEIIAVADPVKRKRIRFANKHNIDPDKIFKDWKDFFRENIDVDGVIISTMDDLHYEPAISAIDKEYNILLEKPISNDLEEILILYRKSKNLDTSIIVAHVLRYTGFFQRIKEIINSNILGDLSYINYVEEIGYYHFAHSYVRGNWRNDNLTAPVILAKSCHDLDIILWLTGKEVKHLSSTGTISYFHQGNKPKESADRCLKCKIESDCIYSAKKIYFPQKSWPTSVITEDDSWEGTYKALKEGPYGRCVYSCDNNVPDTQTVELELEDSINVQFTLTAFSNNITRRIKIYGSQGELEADLRKGLIKIKDFKGFNKIEKISSGSGGHEGGDHGLMNHFVYLCQKNRIQNSFSSTLSDSIESHLLAFAAEEARKNKKKINFAKWKSKNF